MPKMKTKGSIKKRFRVTATGKIKRERAFASHLLEKKNKKRKRRLRRGALVDPSSLKQIKRMLPYGGR